MMHRTITIHPAKVSNTTLHDFPALMSPFNLFPNQRKDEMTILLDEKGRLVKQVADGDDCWITVPTVWHDRDTVITAVSGTRTQLLSLRVKLALRRFFRRPIWEKA